MADTSIQLTMIQQIQQAVGADPDGYFGPLSQAALDSASTSQIEAVEAIMGTDIDGVWGQNDEDALAYVLGALSTRIVKPSPPQPPLPTPGPRPMSPPAGPLGPVALPLRNIQTVVAHTMSGCGTKIYQIVGTNIYFWRSHMDVDADGAPKAYGPPGMEGLDYLANAGSPGAWYGIATDPSGEPYVQADDDPAPGYYVSTTSLQDPTKVLSDPRRYCNAQTVPYIVIPLEVRLPIQMGDFATVVNLRMPIHTTTQILSCCHAVCGDEGPITEIGEASIMVAQGTNVPADPKSGGQDGDVLYIVYAGTKLAPGIPTPAQIAGIAAPLYVQLPLSELETITVS